MDAMYENGEKILRNCHTTGQINIDKILLDKGISSFWNSLPKQYDLM